MTILYPTLLRPISVLRPNFFGVPIIVPTRRWARFLRSIIYAQLPRNEKHKTPGREQRVALAYMVERPVGIVLIYFMLMNRADYVYAIYIILLLTEPRVGRRVVVVTDVGLVYDIVFTVVICVVVVPFVLFVVLVVLVSTQQISPGGLADDRWCYVAGRDVIIVLVRFVGAPEKRREQRRRRRL